MNRSPQFSVIITTHTRPRLVVQCIESVLAQTLPPVHYEIIVVDDGSRPRTACVLARYRDRVCVFRQDQQGWGVARQTGVQHSRGRIVVFLDDDCVAPPDWLARYAHVYAQFPDAGGVGGGLRPSARLNVAGRKQYAGHLAYFNRMNAPLGAQADTFGRVWFTFGGNRSFRREVWLAAQATASAWYSAWYYDDTLIDLALREQDAVIFYDPAIWVTHHYVLSVAQRLRAAYRFGRSERFTAPVQARLGATSAEPHTARRSGPETWWPSLRRDADDATVSGLAWYALTQPGCWLARQLGRWRE
ncbi:MAG: glycosyltransferase family 2 protein [Chloroflexi bacterium]|nr:glycosyltransferase family 2 protein [Chloroflexota bacterium]